MSGFGGKYGFFRDIRLTDGALNVKITDSDWSMVLPSDPEEGFDVSVLHKENDNNVGTITPYGTHLIDGEANKYLNGRGEVTIRYNEGEWVVEKQTTFISEKDLGRSKYVDFVNVTSVVVNHNLERIPLTEVWVENDEGYMVKSNVDLTHNWETENEFSIEFDNQQTGRIIYI